MKNQLIEYGKQGLKLDFPVIDIHAHIGNSGLIPVIPITAQIQEMTRIGIKSAIVSHMDGISGDIHNGNISVYESAKRFQGKLYCYCHVSANYPENLEEELENCFKHKLFVGIKVYQTGINFNDPDYEPVWQFAKKNSIPILAHTWGGNLTGFDKVAKKFRSVPFIAGHAGSVFTYKEYVKVAEEIKNLYLDLTYSREYTNMIEYFVKEIGAERIVWGSDTPVFSMSHQLGKVLFARISDNDKFKILYTNAASLFGIS